MPNFKDIWTYIENDKLLKGLAILIIGMVIFFIIMLFVKFFFMNPPKQISKYPQTSNDSTETKNDTSNGQ